MADTERTDPKVAGGDNGSTEEEKLKPGEKFMKAHKDLLEAGMDGVEQQHVQKFLKKCYKMHKSCCEKAYPGTDFAHKDEYLNQDGEADDDENADEDEDEEAMKALAPVLQQTAEAVAGLHKDVRSITGKVD